MKLYLSVVSLLRRVVMELGLQKVIIYVVVACCLGRGFCADIRKLKVIVGDSVSIDCGAYCEVNRCDCRRSDWFWTKADRPNESIRQQIWSRIYGRPNQLNSICHSGMDRATIQQQQFGLSIRGIVPSDIGLSLCCYTGEIMFGKPLVKCTSLVSSSDDKGNSLADWIKRLARSPLSSDLPCRSKFLAQGLDRTILISVLVPFGVLLVILSVVLIVNWKRRPPTARRRRFISDHMPERADKMAGYRIRSESSFSSEMIYLTPTNSPKQTQRPETTENGECATGDPIHASEDAFVYEGDLYDDADIYEADSLDDSFDIRVVVERLSQTSADEGFFNRPMLGS